MPPECAFCSAARHDAGGAIVTADPLATIIACRAAPHAGHFLVVPRCHGHSLGEMDEVATGALIHAVTRVLRAIDLEWPGTEVQLWRAPPGTPHPHFHLVPRCATTVPTEEWLDRVCRRLRGGPPPLPAPDEAGLPWCDCSVPAAEAQMPGG